MSEEAVPGLPNDAAKAAPAATLDAARARLAEFGTEAAPARVLVLIEREGEVQEWFFNGPSPTHAIGMATRFAAGRSRQIDRG